MSGNHSLLFVHLAGWQSLTRERTDDHGHDQGDVNHDDDGDGVSFYHDNNAAGDTSSVSRQLPFGSQANQRGSPGSLLSGSTSPQAKHQVTCLPALLL